jgi:peroxiredoxin Q/BCP
MKAKSKLENKKPPEFCLKNQDDKNICLKDYKGNWILVYFYPKDFTPGCTKEACMFRDYFKDLKKEGVTVLGISADSVESHKKFAEKHELPFDVLSDETKEVIKKFKALRKKKMFGKEYLGIVRISFLIDPKYKVVKEYSGVKPQLHAKEVLENVVEMKK